MWSAAEGPAGAGAEPPEKQGELAACPSFATMQGARSPQHWKRTLSRPGHLATAYNSRIRALQAT